LDATQTHFRVALRTDYLPQLGHDTHPFDWAGAQHSQSPILGLPKLAVMGNSIYRQPEFDCSILTGFAE
jgi:hypothetical protein